MHKNVCKHNACKMSINIFFYVSKHIPNYKLFCHNTYTQTLDSELRLKWILKFIKPIINFTVMLVTPSTKQNQKHSNSSQCPFHTCTRTTYYCTQIATEQKEKDKITRRLMCPCMTASFNFSPKLIIIHIKITETKGKSAAHLHKTL